MIKIRFCFFLLKFDFCFSFFFDDFVVSIMMSVKWKEYIFMLSMLIIVVNSRSYYLSIWGCDHIDAECSVSSTNFTELCQTTNHYMSPNECHCCDTTHECYTTYGISRRLLFNNKYMDYNYDMLYDISSNDTINKRRLLTRYFDLFRYIFIYWEYFS